MNNVKIAELATTQAIGIWNSMPEKMHENALFQYGTTENAIAEIAMCLVRGVARRITTSS